MKNNEHERSEMRRLASQSLALTVLLILSACGGNPGPASAPAAPQASLPSELFVSEAPQGALNVIDAKKAFQPGETILIRGRIGGSQPFVKGRASMTLYDVALPPCNANPTDTCPTPWDYCCETKESRIAHAASVQVLGPDGKALATGLEGAHDLAPLDILIVKGVVDKSSQGANLIVNAQQIFIEERGKRAAPKK